MKNVIQFPKRIHARPLARCAARPTDELEPLVAAELSGDGRIIIRVPFASAYVTTEQAREFARRLLDLVHDAEVK